VAVVGEETGAGVQGVGGGVGVVDFEVEGVAVEGAGELGGEVEGSGGEAFAAGGGEDVEFVEESGAAGAFEAVAEGEDEVAVKGGGFVEEVDVAEGGVVEEILHGGDDGGGEGEGFVGVEVAHHREEEIAVGGGGLGEGGHGVLAAYLRAG
jgi:hypothetical protein